MVLNKITIVVGFDQGKTIAYHTFCQSILEKSTVPVQFIPLAKNCLSFYIEDFESVLLKINLKYNYSIPCCNLE
jgi:hypothetical protein